jgi:hypothetical protein
MNVKTDLGSAYSLVSLLPKSATCFSFVQNSVRLRTAAWLVPHIVRYKENSEVVSWRCSWGHICESHCYYANTSS